MAIEANYMDLGNGNVDVGPFNFEPRPRRSPHMPSFSLPIPLPILDIYAKAGVARWELTAPSTAQGSIDLDDKGTDFAYGAGAQLNFGSLGVRLEYETVRRQHTDGVELLTLGANLYLPLKSAGTSRRRVPL